MHVEDHDSLERLYEEAKHYRNTRTWPRVQAVILAKQGEAAPRIAHCLGWSRRAVQAWVAAYNHGGLAALPGPPLPRPRAHPAPRPRGPIPGAAGCPAPTRLWRLLPARRGHPLHPGAGIQRPLQHRRRLQAAPPARLRQPDARPQHPDTDPEAQEFFKEIVLEQIEAIAEEHPGEEVRVWVHDEARFDQQGTITRVWARRGSRPRRLRQTGRESLYVLTAAYPSSGSAFGLIMPELNTAVINQYLEQFSRQLAPGVRAVLLWDNAGYHVSRGLVVPSNVSLIGLLPYSPELNPVENLWHYLRSHYWSNRVFPDYESLREAAMEAGVRSVWTRRRSRQSARPPILNSAHSFSDNDPTHS